LGLFRGRNGRHFRLAGHGWVRNHAVERHQAAFVGTIVGIDAALEAVELRAKVLDSHPHGQSASGHLESEVVALDVDPELGLGFAETALEPVGVNQAIDEEALLGEHGLPAHIIVGGQGGELVAILAGDDLAVGVDASVESIEAGDFLAPQSTWPG
jgi:hypothetical protein